MGVLGLVRAQNVAADPPSPGDGRGPTVCYAERPVPGASAQEPTDDVSIHPATGSDVLEETRRLVAPPDVAMPLSVGGLPAMLVTQPEFYVRCRLEMRTAPGQGVEIFVGRTRDGVGDTCDVARAVGEAVAANLPQRQP